MGYERFQYIGYCLTLPSKFLTSYGCVIAPVAGQYGHRFPSVYPPSADEPCKQIDEGEPEPGNPFWEVPSGWGNSSHFCSQPAELFETEHFRDQWIDYARPTTFVHQEQSIYNILKAHETEVGRTSCKERQLSTHVQAEGSPQLTGVFLSKHSAGAYNQNVCSLTGVQQSYALSKVLGFLERPGEVLSGWAVKRLGCWRRSGMRTSGSRP